MGADVNADLRLAHHHHHPFDSRWYAMALTPPQIICCCNTTSHTVTARSLSRWRSLRIFRVFPPPHWPRDQLADVYPAENGLYIVYLLRLDTNGLQIRSVMGPGGRACKDTALLILVAPATVRASWQPNGTRGSAGHPTRHMQTSTLVMRKSLVLHSDCEFVQ